MPSLKFIDLELAFDFVSGDSPSMNEAYISRMTGKIFWKSEFSEIEEEELPDDLEDPKQYISVPHKNDLDLGRRLVMRFVGRELPEDYKEVEEIFGRKGAYSRYKDLLDRKGKLQAWFDYEEEKTEAALREWCEEEGIELIEAAD